MTGAPSARYVIVDAHNLLFSTPSLRKLAKRQPHVAREFVVKSAAKYADVDRSVAVVVFDGTGKKVTEDIATSAGVQIFYGSKTKSADEVIEKLVRKYGAKFSITVVTADIAQSQTTFADGARVITPEVFWKNLEQLSVEYTQKYAKYFRN